MDYDAKNMMHLVRLLLSGENIVKTGEPIVRFDGERLLLDLSLAKAAGGYEAGRQTIDLGVQTDRYRDQLREFAEVVRGEMPNPVEMYDHDLRVHEITLKACGYDKR